MLKRDEIRIPSNDGINKIFVRKWLPEGGPASGVLVLAHGMSEHSLRYDRFAAELAREGIAVYAPDHLGHGKTAEQSGEIGFFAVKDGWKTIVADLESVSSLARAENPGVPATLFGHSMGSFMARTHMLLYPGAFDYYILSGTGYNSAISVKAGKLIAKREIAKNGEKSISKGLDSLCFGAFNKPFKNESASRFNWLSRDRREVEKYDADEYCGFILTASAFADLFDGLLFIQNKNNLKSLPGKTRVLLISGGDDPVGARGKGVRRVAKMLERAGADIVQKLYPGLRHELLNELTHAEVIDFLIKSIKAVQIR